MIATSPGAQDSEGGAGAAQSLAHRTARRRRLGMVVLSLMVAGLFVVQPAQQARAIFPVVAWGAAALARSVLPGIAARAGFTAFTTPLRAVAVTSAGVRTINVGQIGLNVAALGLGFALLPLANSNGEPAVELGADQDTVDALDAIVAEQNPHDGQSPLPHRVSGGRCFVELQSVLWEYVNGAVKVTTLYTSGGVPGSWSAATTEQHRQYCSGGIAVSGMSVNTATGHHQAIAGGTQVVVSSSGYNTQHRVVTQQPSGTYGAAAGYYFESVTLKTHKPPNTWMPPEITFGTWSNPYTQGGEPVVPLEDGDYYGKRECVPNGGGPGYTITQKGQNGIPIPGACREGYYSAGYGVWQGDPAAGGVELFAVGSTENWNLNADGTRDYPGCVASDGVSSNGRCELSVSVDGRQCAYGVIGCAGWMELGKNGDPRVVCTWGSYSMPYTDCAQLQYAYSTPYGVQVPQMVGGNGPGFVPVASPGQAPYPGTHPGTVPGSVPLPVTDPGGTPWPDPISNPPPTTDPAGAGTVPLVGTQPVPRDEAIVDPDLRAQDCMAAIWSWNPVDWVYTPIKCATEWAFVPRAVAVRQMQADMQSQMQGTTLARYAAAIATPVVAPGGMNGCTGPRLSLTIFGGEYDGYPFSACAEPTKGMADFSRIFSMVGVWIMAGVSVSRSVAATIGFTKIGGDSQ